MDSKAFQEYYPDQFNLCYGCGQLNEHGLQIKSFWDGEEALCIFTPRPYHTAIPGYVYGGLIASLIDCHSTGTAAAAAFRAEGRAMDTPLLWKADMLPVPPLYIKMYGYDITRDIPRTAEMLGKPKYTIEQILKGVIQGTNTDK